MSLNTISRERRSWTAKEDQLLREAVQKEDPDNANPSKWHAIAKHVPNRTNKDCRKRWFAKMASDVVKGGWSPEEDERLVKGIERYGTRWSLVASVVQSRNSDQCAKRWTDTLNPAIDRTSWTSEADELLLRAVDEHGKVWTKIVKTYFPGRTGLSAKNRYNSITRFNSDSSRTARPRRKSADMLHHHSMTRKSNSISSSSSVSPASTNVSLPYSTTFQHPLDVKPNHYQLEQYANGWSSSSSVTTDEISSYRSSPMTFDYSPDTTTPSTPSPNSDYQSYDLSMNHHVSPYTEPTQLYQDPAPSGSHTTQAYKAFPGHSHADTAFQSHQYPSHYPAVQVHSGNEPTEQFGLYENQAAAVETSSAIAGMNWDAMSSTQDVKPLSGGFRAPLSNNAYSYVF